MARLLGLLVLSRVVPLLARRVDARMALGALALVLFTACTPKTVPSPPPSVAAAPTTAVSPSSSVTLTLVPEGSFGAGAYRLNGGNAPKLLKKVQPAYPLEEMSTKGTRVVIIEAIIARDGSIQDTRVVRTAGRSLDQAALNAVKQWKYMPTLLNGVPVEVINTVTVTFTMQ